MAQSLVADRRLADLSRKLVVSVQADPGSPLRDVAHIRALAACAIKGGAAGLRLQGLEDVAAVRRMTDLPIIGLIKQVVPGTDVYITPMAALARQLLRAGADIIAIDATLRPRPESFEEIAGAVKDLGGTVLADIATVQEAVAAMAAGADCVATTLSGYTGASAPEGPDFPLMAELARLGIPFAAEGRINSPEEARRAMALGAHCVIVGTAITRPDVVTSWYAAAVAQARSLEDRTTPQPARV